MDLQLNIIAILVASLAAFILGGLWYSPLMFEKKWRQLVGTAVNQEAGNPIVIYGGAFVLILLSAAVFDAFLGPNPSLGFAVGVGVSAGVAWAAGSLWLSYLFEGRPSGLYFINGGYHILQFTLYGLVFALV